MRKHAAIALLAIALASTSSPAAANPVEFGTIWLNGSQVRTLLPPSDLQHPGIDAFYRVPGTGGVAAVGPGTGDYHGGAWQVFDVTWNVTPYPLTSAGAVLAAAAAGKGTLTRNPGAGLPWCFPPEP